MKNLYLVLLLTLISSICFGQNLSFKQVPGAPPAPQMIPLFTGLSRGAAASADVNNDGCPDIIVTGYTTNGVKATILYLGNVFGNYTEATGTPFIDVVSSAIATADIDNDGDIDVLISGKGPSNLFYTTLYKNDGNGVFTIVPGTIFENVAAGTIDFSDVDGDGDQDVFITGVKGSSARVSNLYTNNGNGVFSLVSGTSFTPVRDGDVAFVDIDNDQDQDILIVGLTSYYHRVSHLYKNNGNGVFTSVNAASIDSVDFGSIDFADIDNDGDMDLLLSGDTSFSHCITSLYTNDGSGNFTQVQGTPFIGVNQGDLVFVDVDNDNDQDIFITGTSPSNENTTKLYLNNGSGGYSAASVGPFKAVRWSSVVVLDVDGDNDKDIFVMGNKLSYYELVDLYINNGQGEYALATGSAFEGVMGGRIAYADVDNDGDIDVFIGGYLNGEATTYGGITTYQSKLYLNNGSGAYQIDTSNVFDSIFCIAVQFADIDGDNDMDLIFSGFDGSYSRITNLYVNNGSGIFSLVTNTPFSAMSCNSIAFADVDADSDLDLLICAADSISSENTFLYSNNGSGVFTLMDDTTFIGVNESAVAFADVDGDNDLDLLITGHKYTHPKTHAKLYINNGSGGFSLAPGNQFTPVKRGAVAFADFDNDSDLDLIISGIHSSGIIFTKLYTNNGSGIFTYVYVSSTPFDNVFYASIAVADIDNDNDIDILISGTNSSYKASLKLFINDSLGNFTYLSGMPFDSLYEGEVAILDTDNDGLKDVLIAGKNAQRRSCTKLYKNTTNTTFGIDICSACDSLTWINGVTYDSSNSTARDTLINSMGGDSIISLYLTIYNNGPYVDVVSACDSFTWIDGNTYTSNNNTAIDSLTSVWGCDSVVYLDLTIHNSTFSVDTVVACDSFTWIDGNTYTMSNNTATDSLISVCGCDSIVQLDLTIHNSTFSVDTVVACDSFTWIDGNTYTMSNNIATDTLIGGCGCDSIVQLDLTIGNPTFSVDTVVACDSFTWIDGNTYTLSNNTATDTLIGGCGCDSIVQLDLTIGNSTFSVDTVVACDSFTWIDGNTYTLSNNTAIDTLIGGCGCDSIVQLYLTIHNSTFSVDTVVACDSFTWIDGNTYTMSNNTATDTLIGGCGCDSIVYLDLTIGNSTFSVDTVVACDSFTWIDGNTYTSNNITAVDTLLGFYGCDSIIRLNLTINTVDTALLVQDPIITAIQNGATYQWLDCANNYAAIPNANAQVYTAVTNGMYAVEITNSSCVDTSRCVNIVSTSISDKELFNQIEVFPNPSSGMVNIKLGNLKDVSVNVYNSNGQLVFHKKGINSSTFSFNLNEAPGLYHIEILTEKIKKSFRLVIK